MLLIFPWQKRNEYKSKQQWPTSHYLRTFLYSLTVPYSKFFLNRAWKEMTSNPKCIAYIRHSMPKSPVCSGGFVQLQLHKADSVYIAGGSRGSTFCLFTGFLLKSSVYHTFIFYYFSLHRQQLWWSRVLHQPLKGSGYLLYCPQNLQDTGILEPQLHVEVSICPFRGPVWITAAAFRRGPLNTAYSSLLLLYTMLLLTEGGKALVDFFT